LPVAHRLLAQAERDTVSCSRRHSSRHLLAAQVEARRAHQAQVDVAVMRDSVQAEAEAVLV
jgi:hypothetical protein